MFCIDTSGSMCVSTPVPGHVQFRGSRTEAMNKALDQFKDGAGAQRLPHERSGVVYVMRLVMFPEIVV